MNFIDAQNEENTKRPPPFVEPKEPPSRLKTMAMWGTLILLLWMATEAVCAATYYLFVKPRFGYMIWNPDLREVHKGWASAELAPADEEIGWPSPKRATSMPYDKAGAKFNPDFPNPAKACASAYGDSFVWGYGVPLNDGWIEQLSRLLKCRISNYGVEGYGVDQAFIRFRRNTSDNASVVLFGIYPQDVMRDVNQYRAFLGFPLQPQYVKGRFIADSAGHLQWLPRPRLDSARFEELHTTPANIVPMDDFLPDTRDGPITKSYSYIATLLSLSLSPRVLTRLTGRASTGDFLSETHPSGAFQLTVDIVAALKQEAEKRGKQLLVVIIPGGSSLREKRTYGSFEYDAFQNELRALGVETFDLGDAILDDIGSGSYCELYTEPSACDGHFSIYGGTVVANLMAKELKRRGFLPLPEGAETR